MLRALGARQFGKRGSKDLEKILFSEIGVLTFNLGLIALGVYFWRQAQSFWAKVSMAAPMFAVHLGVLPTVIIGCELGLFGDTFCREAFWLLVALPPFFFAFGIVQLTLFCVLRRQKA